LDSQSTKTTDTLYLRQRLTLRHAFDEQQLSLRAKGKDILRSDPSDFLRRVVQKAVVEGQKMLSLKITNLFLAVLLLNSLPQ
jgi:hypothetical protein